MLVNNDFNSWILPLLILYIIFIRGLNACQTEFITNASLTTKLQSDVRLPCSFKLDLLKSNMTADISVVWSQLTTAEKDIVEITLEGEAKFWNSRGGRIRTFPKLKPGLPEFSILIRNVQQSDLGLYNCKLFRGIGCLLAYKEIELQKAVISENTLTWLIPAGATGGGAVLFVSLIIAFKLFKRQKNITSEPFYENTNRTKSTNEKSQKKIGNECIYANSSMSSRTTSPNEENLQSKKKVQGIVFNNPVYS